MIFKAKRWDKKEKRKYRRANVLMPVHFSVVHKILKDNHVNLTFLGVCRNISGGGMLLEVADLKEEMLLCNNLLKLEIKLPVEEKPIHIFSRLVKAERSLTQDSYYLRLCFVGIEDKDREKIIKFSDKHLSKGKH